MEEAKKLYSLIKQVMTLPEYIDTKRVLRELLDTWKQKDPTVADVIAGKTSFEQIVKPIADQNSSITANLFSVNPFSDNFIFYAAGYSNLLKNILDITYLARNPRKLRLTFFWPILIAPIIMFVLLFSDDYSNATLMAKHIRLTIVLECLAIGICLCLQINYKKDTIRNRRETAKKKIEQAKFLDDTIREAYSD